MIVVHLSFCIVISFLWNHGGGVSERWFSLMLIDILRFSFSSVKPLIHCMQQFLLDRYNDSLLFHLLPFYALDLDIFSQPMAWFYLRLTLSQHLDFPEQFRPAQAASWHAREIFLHRWKLLEIDIYLKHCWNLEPWNPLIHPLILWYVLLQR